MTIDEPNCPLNRNQTIGFNKHNRDNNSTSEHLTDAQRPGGVLRGGRLEIGVKRKDKDSGIDRFHRSAPPLSRFFASFLADPRKEGPRQGPEPTNSVVSVGFNQQAILLQILLLCFFTIGLLKSIT